MRNPQVASRIRKTAGTTLLGLALTAMLSACQPDPPAEPAVPEPPPPQLGPVTPSDAPAPGGDAAGAQLPVTGGQGAVAGAVADAAAATVKKEPELASMKLATAESSKLGVPVDLRYSFDGTVEPGRPVTVHLAAVPRVEGTNLNVSIKEDPALQFAAAPFVAQKASSSTAYRQQLSVMKLASGPAELRVLVTMQVGETSAFSWFGVPLTEEAARPAGK